MDLHGRSLEDNHILVHTNQNMSSAPLPLLLSLLANRRARPLGSCQVKSSSSVHIVSVAYDSPEQEKFSSDSFFLLLQPANLRFHVEAKKRMDATRREPEEEETGRGRRSHEDMRGMRPRAR